MRDHADANIHVDWTSEARDAREELDALQRQQRRRDAPPLLYCKLVTEWTRPAFGTCALRLYVYAI